VRSLRKKALAKLGRYPHLFDALKVRRARTIYDFDDAVTGPVHGFANAHDYYEKSSSIGFLAAIKVPTLLLSSFDDPFMPAEVLRRVQRLAAVNDVLCEEFHTRGGHVGFVAGAPWRPFYYAEARVFDFFEHRMERARASSYD
jgi:predicted alpha/beta-fold hydrolase